MKTIVAVIFLVFVIVIGLTVVEKDRALFYYELMGSTSNTATIDDSDVEKVNVKLTGCVQKPGTYTIEKDGFLNDAIEKAGGITAEADILCFSFYLIIETDMEIYIPKETTAEKVSLNGGSLEDFQSLSGIGTTLSQRIVAYRAEIGEFTYLEQLMNVSGLGKSIFNNIKDSICL